MTSLQQFKDEMIEKMRRREIEPNEPELRAKMLRLLNKQ